MRRAIQVVLLLLVTLVGARAFAQSAPKDPQGWETVDGDMMAPGETLPAARLVGAAYGFVFVAMLVWVASVARRTRRLEDEVHALRSKLQTH